MSRVKLEPLPSEFAGTLARFQAWRATRKNGMPIPAELWAEAVDWAKRHGTNRICRPLGLGFTDLKKRVGPVQGQGLCQLPDPVKPTFIEMDGRCLLGGAVSGPVLEVFSSDGGRMVLHLPAGSPVDTRGLVSSFLGRP